MGKRGILAGFTSGPGECPSWLEAEHVAANLMAPVVGALRDEVTFMNSLTTNLHLLLASFYRPKQTARQRTRILIEEGSFASDRVRTHRPR